MYHPTTGAPETRSTGKMSTSTLHITDQLTGLELINQKSDRRLIFVRRTRFGNGGIRKTLQLLCNMCKFGLLGFGRPPLALNTFPFYDRRSPRHHINWTSG